MKLILTFACITLFLWGCSVKENRDECPCLVEIDLSSLFDGSFPENMLSGTSVVFMEGEKTGNELVDNIRIEGCGGLRRESVKRDIYAVGMLLPRDFTAFISIGERRSRIPYGRQADSLYGFCCKVDARGDTAKVKVIMHKQFSTITVNAVDESLFDDYILVAEGSVCGIDALNLSPSAGEFRAYLTRDGDGMTFRMPRQDDDGIKLLLLAENSSNPDFTIPLGRMLLNSGYDFHSEDLPDAYVTIDLKRHKAAVRIEGWDDEWIYEII